MTTKRIFILLISILSSSISFAQLYSSGNNAISGSNVGIGINSPSASLEIRTFFDPNAATCVGCPPSSPQPSISIRQDLVGATTPAHTKWSILGGSELGFRFYNSSTASAIDLLKLSTSHSIWITNRVSIHDYLEVTSTSLGAYLGLGAKRVGSNWDATHTTKDGVGFEVTSTGTLRISTGITQSSTSGDNVLTVTPSKRIGINNSYPQEALDILNGNAIITNGRLELKNSRLVLSASNGTKHFEVKPNGYVIAREILVDINQAIPDYVFADDYDLMPLQEVKAFIEKENHLPKIPSAAEYEEKGGIEVGELTRLLLEKQEELLLYTLQLEERLGHLEIVKD